ncbi:hypothetical protein [Kushneria phosphatilytica]|uniref:Uncharacterized protein n=1 Tax=Kushneria phosphatilytica TaxID=657387 RepID=A0A1S1NT46_9GAMM|nr:hypothetical protein [Kushneria phosphatilytica]OHV07515.1 hypothetical protein BH688_14890 [Kushneria phosphatilytica]QEL09998.1 hypothetical protein FY550_01845 [Kushneria phosphatilytica]
MPLTTLVTETTRAIPPGLVSLLHAGGMTPADWVSVLTLCYLTLQIGLILTKYVHRFQQWRVQRGRRHHRREET